MKRMTALILMIAMLAVCAVPALADRPVPDDGYEPKREWRLCYGHGEYKLKQEDQIGDADITYNAIFAGDELTRLAAAFELEDGYAEDMVFTGSGTLTEGKITFSDGRVWKFDGKVWRDENGEKVDADPSWLYDGYKPEFKWYKNTVCLLGLPIRDLKPGLTDKWYTVVPVDLTKDATYTYPLIAGSIYYLGECQVNVKDGQVTTDFSLPEGLCWDEKHCLQWFTSLDDITTDFLNDPKGSFTFGQPVSISGDLKGQDVALLFICNQAEYRIPLFYTNKHFLTRYYSTQDQVKAAQAEMTTLLAKIK